MKVKRNHRWKNVTKDFDLRVENCFFPEHLHDLSDIIRKAEQEGKKVKVVGSGHSYSEVAVPDHLMIDMRRLDKILPIKEEWIKPAFLDPQQDLQLLHVQAGISLQQLNKLLEERKLGLINMGAVDNQTISGAISTGTHGTGLDLPAVQGMVRQIVLVTHGGKVIRIEPTDGITDRDKYDNPNIELKQDDDYFNSVLLSLGSMGVIYSFIIAVRKEYWLEETKTLSRWSEVKPLLKDRSLFERDADGRQVYRGISVLVNPYLNEETKDHLCLVVRHREIPKPDRRTLGESLPNLLGHIGGILPIGILIAFQTLYEKPEKMPKLLDSALKSIKDKKYINVSHKVLHQGIELTKSKALSAEFAVDFYAQDPDYVDVVDQIIKKAAALAREGLYQTSPLSLRFVQQSPAFLALENQSPVCYIDVPLLTKSPGRKRILQEHQDLVLLMGGFPHWGKINDRLDGVNQPDLIRNRFPNLHKWEKVFNELNPNGTFSNRFTERLNLGKLTRPQA